MHEENPCIMGFELTALHTMNFAQSEMIVREFGDLLNKKTRSLVNKDCAASSCVFILDLLFPSAEDSYHTLSEIRRVLDYDISQQSSEAYLNLNSGTAPQL